MNTLTAIAFIPLIAILRGLVLVKLWAWFIVLQFGLAPLRIPVALGIALVVSFLTYQSTPENKDSVGERIGKAVMNNLVVLLLGWVYSLFI